MSATLFHRHEFIRRVWRLVGAPILLYTTFFVLLSFPLVLQFNTAFLMPYEDGYQMVWDLWWVRRSLLQLHQSPFSTQLLHFPHGTSLWLHTLMPFNGLLNILLTGFLTDIQAFNALVVLAFAASGLTAFWLCWKATRFYWPSMAGGFAFEFCSYRWAHTYGHLNLISTEAMPLYLLGWLCLIERPRVFTAIGTAAALLVALLCDQYQFLYCFLVTVIILAWWAVRLGVRHKAVPRADACSERLPSKRM